MLLSGCGPATDRYRYDENYRTGTRGLEMEFGRNSPPAKLYDDEELRVIIELRNRGATDIHGYNSRI